MVDVDGAGAQIYPLCFAPQFRCEEKALGQRRVEVERWRAVSTPRPLSACKHDSAVSPMQGARREALVRCERIWQR
jgi:hypothetical protein